MIKKKYLVAFVLLFCVVVISSSITYNINYSLYVDEVKSNLQDISDTASYQYDSIFFEIYNTVDTTLMKLKDPALTKHDMDALIKECSKNSYYIRDMTVISEKGDYLTSPAPQQMVNMNKIMPFFSKDDVNFDLIKNASEDDNVYYAVKKFEFSNQKKGLLLVGLDYDQINMIVHPDKYKLNDGSLCLISNDGFLLYHKDKELMGKNLLTDETFIKRLTTMNTENYNKLLSAINNTNHVHDQYYLNYSAYGTNKIAYYNYLKVFPGITFLAIDYKNLLYNQIQSLLRTIIPLLLSLAIATYLLLRYIFLIKYTDYFTEVKNEHAFRKHLRKLAKRGCTEEYYLILEIVSVSSNGDKDFLYDDRIFYHLSAYFKKINSFYNGLYRISRVHYMFVLKDHCDESCIRKLMNQLNDDIDLKGDHPLYIRGKKLLFTLDRLNELNHFEVDSKVLSHMAYHNSDLSDYDDLTCVRYSQILANINQRLKEKLYLESAILNNTFVPHYQPIIDLQTDRIYKHEVLMRVADQNQSMSTAKLIKVAEEENMVEKVDRAIIQQSFYQYNKELHKTRKSLRLSINLSGKSINQKMVDYIEEMAKKCKIIPSHITFELTETAALNNLDASIKSLNALREMGFKLAIDDFGTGYAHVELLSKLVVDYIKIDGMFILDVDKDEQKLKTLNALVYIAKNYNAKIIAEFVENENVVLILKKLGIEYGQGYYFGKPSEDVV